MSSEPKSRKPFICRRRVWPDALRRQSETVGHAHPDPPGLASILCITCARCTLMVSPARRRRRRCTCTTGRDQRHDLALAGGERLSKRWRRRWISSSSFLVRACSRAWVHTSIGASDGQWLRVRQPPSWRARPTELHVGSGYVVPAGRRRAPVQAIRPAPGDDAASANPPAREAGWPARQPDPSSR